MKRWSLRAMWRGCVLLVLALASAVGYAQAPAVPSAPVTQKAAPAVAPEAYRIRLNNMLVYRVLITSRPAQQGLVAAMEKTDRRELAVFDVDAEDNLVVYMGVPKDKPAAPAPAAPPPAEAHRGDRGQPRPAAPAVSPPAEEKAQPVELTWTKHVLGKGFTRNSDGTISYTPAADEAVPYPILPLPPRDVKEKDRFELTMLDIAAGAGKTVPVVAHWVGGTDGKISITANFKPKITPGVPPVPEMAVFNYEVSAEPAAVTRLNVSRRLPGERAEAVAAEAPRPQGIGRGPRGEGGARRPAAPAGGPIISIVINLAETKVLSEDQHRALVATASGTMAEHHGHGETAAPNAAEATSDPNVPPEVRGMIERMQKELGSK